MKQYTLTEGRVSKITKFQEVIILIKTCENIARKKCYLQYKEEFSDIIKSMQLDKNFANNDDILNRISYLCECLRGEVRNYDKKLFKSENRLTSCSVCNSDVKLVLHHEGYDDNRTVTVLCNKCHCKHHGKYIYSYKTL